jgi:hypothetical protein
MTNDADLEEPIRIVVPREAVEARETKEVLMGLSVFAQSPALAPQALGKVRIEFEGYERDARELWQIPEVRRFIADLDEAFPFWFYFADLRSETLHVLASCLCAVTEVAPGQTVFDDDDFYRFLQRQFGGMNHLWDAHSLPDDENVARSEQLVQYFANRQILN